MSQCLIIFNPDCSKCRTAKDLIQANGMEPEIIEYLSGELTEDLLRKTLSLLKVRAGEILREKEYDSENDEEVIAAILKHPYILQRPIVIIGNKAVIGRPPEKILEIL
jgi:arsenate reductase (glutaredoxin)